MFCVVCVQPRLEGKNHWNAKLQPRRKAVSGHGGTCPVSWLLRRLEEKEEGMRMSSGG